MSEPRILCRYDELVPIQSLVPYKKNRNQHTPEQIERLAYLMENLGVRAPIVVAKAPFNCIAKGHGTTEAFRLNGWDQIPVVHQEFYSEDELYQFVQSDNAITEWASLDLKSINTDLESLGPFDIDLLGIKDFTVDLSEKTAGTDPEKKHVEFEAKAGDSNQQCPRCGYAYRYESRGNYGIGFYACNSCL